VADTILRALLALLLWPGLLGSVALGWFFLWLGRKVTARLQGRHGPPFYQPMWDFFKLLGKRTVIPAGADRRLFVALPLLSVVCVISALALIPVPGTPVISFVGDLVLVLYLLEMPALIDVLAGYGSRSIYGQVSAAREAVASLAYNLPFLAAVIAVAMAAGSFSLTTIAKAPFGLVHVVAGMAFLLSLPGRLKTNPFSIPNAEQEILAGAYTEYNGAPLAMFELAHALEIVALAGLFSVLFVPAPASPLLAGLLHLVVMVVVVLVVTLIAAGTARIKLHQAFRFYWSWGAAAALLAIAVAAFVRL
jgi:NADH-quinone oxidoreductase subunit H